MSFNAISKIIIVGALATTLLALPAASQAVNLSTIPLSSLPTASSAPLSEGSEPVSFIYLGTEAQITQLFTGHGWYGADRISAASLLKAYRAARDNAPYPTAPFSPAFIGSNVHDLAFQMPTPANTIAQRHHTRLWNTGLTTTDERQIWVGTASYDRSIARYGQTNLPLHHIDANLPAERQFIIRSLGVKNAQYVQLQPAGSGRNSFGDPYYFDGRAAIIDLGGSSVTSTRSTATPQVTPQPNPKATPAPKAAASSTTSSKSRIKAYIESAVSRFSTYWSNN